MFKGTMYYIHVARRFFVHIHIKIIYMLRAMTNSTSMVFNNIYAINFYVFISNLYLSKILLTAYGVRN